jgi:hypothetical protein
VEFTLKGSNGYSISVSGNRETVTLTAKRGSSSVTYMADGFASPTKIKARLGRLGRTVLLQDARMALTQDGPIQMDFLEFCPLY